MSKHGDSLIGAGIMQVLQVLARQRNKDAWTTWLEQVLLSLGRLNVMLLQAVLVTVKIMGSSHCRAGCHALTSTNQTR